MNTTLATPVGRTEHQHPPSSTHDLPQQRRRVGLIDRLALRLGVALVAWSRRPRELDSRDHLARRVEHELSNEQRELQRQRLLLQLLPPR